MQEIYPLMLMTGLTGGFGHCLGMCGPVVASCAMTLPTRSIVPHLLYHAGRLTTYMLLGGLMGLGGSFGQGVGVSISSWAASLAASCCQVPVSPPWLLKIPLILAGGLIVAMGLSTAGFLPLDRYLENCLARLPGLRNLRPWFAGRTGARYFYPMGAAMGFIPCGLVYSALIATAGTGLAAPDPLAGLVNGMGLMLLFGAGTALPLLLFGKVAVLLGARVRQRFYRLSGLLVVVMGLLLLLRAVRL